MKNIRHSGILFLVFAFLGTSLLHAQWQNNFAKSKEEYLRNEPDCRIWLARKEILIEQLQLAVTKRNMDLLAEIFQLAEANFIHLANDRFFISFSGGFGDFFTPLELVRIDNDQSRGVYDFLRAQGANGPTWEQAREDARARAAAREQQRQEDHERWEREREARERRRNFRRGLAGCTVVSALLILGASIHFGSC
jgi:hypothetical protein